MAGADTAPWCPLLCSCWCPWGRCEWLLITRSLQAAGCGFCSESGDVNFSKSKVGREALSVEVKKQAQGRSQPCVRVAPAVWDLGQVS